MSKYFLALESNNEFKDINLSNLNGGANLTNLNLLVDFTTRFNNEEELKICLMNDGLINKEDIKKKLIIHYNSNKENKKLIYGVSYKSDKKYFDEMLLLKTIKSKKNDISFLNSFYTTYKKNYFQNIIFNIKSYISDVKNNLKREDSDEMFDNSVDLFFYLNVYKTNKNNKEIVLNFKFFRDLAMFVSNYEKNIKSKTNSNKLYTEKSNNYFNDLLFYLYESGFAPNSNELELALREYGYKIDGSNIDELNLIKRKQV